MERPLPDLSKLRGVLAAEQVQVPDEIGYVEGWRAWGIPERGPLYGTSAKLFSVTRRDYFWTPRQRCQAQCRGSYTCRRGGDVPGDTCSCGFYSNRSLAHLMRMKYHRYDAERNGLIHVIGRVANWGKVIEGSQGWKSQYSYPLELFVPFEAYKLVAPLKETYGVPVGLKNHLKAYHQMEESTYGHR
jgi:hypothetical protein